MISEDKYKNENLSMPLQVSLSNRFSRVYLALPLLMSSIAVTAAVDSDAYYDETDLLVDIPMVSSGSRMQQTAYNSPSSVTVIDSDMIAALAPNNLVDVLRLAPGFMSFYINGSLPALSGHDLTDDDPRRMEVRVNGRSVYVPSYPTVSWMSLGITPDDIERIELVRGSNVPAYGSNAIMGAVEITTKSPIKESGTHVRVTGGDRDTRNINVRSNIELENGYGQWRVSSQQNSGFDGFDGLDGTDILDDDTSVSHMVFNAALTPTLVDVINFEIGLSKGKLGIGDVDRPEEFADDENRSYWLTTGWTRVKQTSQWKWNFSLYDIKNEQSVEKLLSDILEVAPAALSDPDIFLETSWGKRETQLWESELEYQQSFTDNLRALIGVGYKFQSTKAPDQLNSDSAIDNAILYGFSNVEWSFARQWLMNFGFMLENQEEDKTHLSPRMSLHYQLTANHNFRISGSQVYRTPSVFESHRETSLIAYDFLEDYHFKADENLEAEEMESVELAYYGRFFDGKLEIDWRTFKEDMTGAIDIVKWDGRDYQDWTFVPDPNPVDDADGNGDEKAYFYSNSKDWRISGYDLQVKWHPRDDTSLYFQYANTRLKSARLRDWDSVLPDEGIDKIPKHTGSFLVMHQFGGGWSAAVMGYHQSFTNWRGGADLDSFHRYDLTVSKIKTFNNYKLRVDLKIDNLTDEVYPEYQEDDDVDPNVGNYFERTVYISAALNW